MARVILAVFLTLIAPAAASADWLITPFLGTAFSGETTFVAAPGAGQKKAMFGASVALLGTGMFGLEADVAHSPRYFQGDTPGCVGCIVLKSRITTLSGNVIVAAPIALTRESLRPYLVGGLGLLQARTDDLIGLRAIRKDLLGLTVGGGAVGFLSADAGVRFDLRHVKAISGEAGSLARPGLSRLSFWRFSVGVAIRY